MASVTEDSEIQDNIKPVESQVWLTKSHVLLKRKAEAQTLWYSRENGSLFVGSGKFTCSIDTLDSVSFQILINLFMDCLVCYVHHMD